MEIRKMSDLFWKVSPNLFYSSILLAVCTGLCYSLLVPFVVYAASTNTFGSPTLEVKDFSFFDSPTSDMARLFLVTCLCIIVIKSLSRIISAYIALKASMEHRFSLYNRIQRLPYISLEQIGHARLINLLTVDVPAVTNAAMGLPIIWVSSVTILGTLGYLVYLDAKVFVFVLSCLGIAMITYQVPMLFGHRYYARSRDQQDRIQEGYKGLIFGSKEMKLNREKAKEFCQDELIEPDFKVLRYDLKGVSIVTFAENYGEIISFLVIGIVVFHFPYVFQLNQQEMFGIVMALLYLTGPVGVILSSIGAMQQGRVSLRKIVAFYSRLVEEGSSCSCAALDDWNSIQLRNVTFRYSDEGFCLNKISAEFRKGQVTFIVGGNGSGKSTLSKILSLHYRATFGEIQFGHQIVGDNNISTARESIGAIYSDFYVFPRLYGNPDLGRIESYIRFLGLDKKVSVVNGRFSTTDLSDGQKKRLALLALLLEDRPVCIFDEWAADQDPEFREIFYLSIIPELRSLGKVVIIVSHDDRYFDCADQIIVMDQGSVREVIEKTQLAEGQKDSANTAYNQHFSEKSI
ncbi:MAG: cyclic peptide export ABC transporter [Cellvibrio sp.]|uniref:cyclic peptide export ABC transporter n=1 Tax=Cellvibrio sp. TaxID=1965322 RepID=UPI0027175A13|nr:cyclic peptide export ABC transporter [Cellvibrio sp.]